ncbi:hypothetical protein EDF39_1305 [Frondihabitans sp. PhB161]|nr:hypothetical protein EDF37_1303 [Frondihabitans sp. PhB153]RPF08905.1 hypothetical protein EDF39_1305 [Frondihabitans sp. PhB161]
MENFVRYQSAVPNRHGRYPGVFALANGLRDHAILTAEDAEWHQEANLRATTEYIDPSSVDPDCYDQSRNPGARAWFSVDAVDALAMTIPYLDLLDRYDVPWVQLISRTPGRIIYSDAVQVVAVPHSYCDDWPFPTPQYLIPTETASRVPSAMRPVSPRRSVQSEHGRA